MAKMPLSMICFSALPNMAPYWSPLGRCGFEIHWMNMPGDALPHDGRISLKGDPVFSLERLWTFRSRSRVLTNW